MNKEHEWAATWDGGEVCVVCGKWQEDGERGSLGPFIDKSKCPGKKGKKVRKLFLDDMRQPPDIT